MPTFLKNFTKNWRWRSINAYFWVMWKQKVMNKAYRLYDKTKKSVILIRYAIFNEVTMVLKEGEPIIDASVYDLIEGQN